MCVWRRFGPAIQKQKDPVPTEIFKSYLWYNNRDDCQMEKKAKTLMNIFMSLGMSKISNILKESWPRTLQVRKIKLKAEWKVSFTTTKSSYVWTSDLLVTVSSSSAHFQAYCYSLPSYTLIPCLVCFLYAFKVGTMQFLCSL